MVGRVDDPNGPSWDGGTGSIGRVSIGYAVSGRTSQRGSDRDVNNRADHHVRVPGVAAHAALNPLGSDSERGVLDHQPAPP